MNNKIALQFKLIISTLVFFSGFNNLSVLAQSVNSSVKPSRPTTAEIQNAKNNLRNSVQSLRNGNYSYYVKEKRNSKQIQDRNKLVDSWKPVEPELAPFIGVWSGYESTWNIYPSNTKGNVCIVQRNEEGSSTIDLGNVIDSNIYTEKGKVLFKDGNYLGVGKIDGNQFVQINDMPLSSPTVLQEPVLLKNINGFSPSVKVLKSYVNNNCTASTPDQNNSARTTIEELPDGNYMYGEVPYKEIRGAKYSAFFKAGNVITGTMYIDGTDNGGCFQGVAKNNEILDASSVNTVLGPPSRDQITRNLSLDFSDFHSVEKTPKYFQKAIDKCSGKIFTYIPQKQFATVSSNQKKASPDIKIPNYVEYGAYKFVKGKSGFYILQQKKDNKCLWVNQKGKLAAFPCEFHDFQKWNLIPISIKENNQALYAVNVRGTFQCLAKDGSITSCNNWKMLLFSSFEL